MPAYNEEANIEETVKAWHPVVEKIGPESRLVIVDDGSKDNTFATMKELSKEFPQFEPITKANSGHGATCLFAYQHALNSQTDWVFQTDSDGQTDPNEFWAFWDKRKDYDFVIGSRNERQDGGDRVFITKVLKMVVWLIFGENVKDPNTPFRLLNAQKLKPILELIPQNFFLSNVVMSMLIVKRKEKLAWLPISFKPRMKGTNSINFKRIFKIGINAVADFRKIKKDLKGA